MKRVLDRRIKKVKSYIPVGYDAAIIRCVCGRELTVSAPQRRECGFIISLRYNKSGFEPIAEAPTGFTAAGMQSLAQPAPEFVAWIETVAP